MRGLIVGVDDSTGARKALRWAARCADTLGEELVATQAWSYPATALLPWGQQSLPPAEEIDATVTGAVEAIVAEELGSRPSPTIRTAAIRGPAGTALIRRAAAADPWLIAVGSRGLGGFAGLLVGSVSRQVLDYATCPVVVVPEGADPGPPEAPLETILAGVDGSAGGQRALEWATELASRTGARLVVAHSFEPVQAEVSPAVADERRSEAESQFQSQWARPAAEAGLEHTSVTIDGDPRATLPELAAQEKADLLVVGSLGRGPFAKLLGSVAASLVSNPTLAVAVVPNDRPSPSH